MSCLAPRGPMARLAWAPLAWWVLAGAPLPAAQNGSRALPPKLDEYVTATVKLTAEERQQLAAGAPVTKLLEADKTKEVAVFGAIWVNAPVRRYVEAIKDIEKFERGGAFKITKRIGSPPRLEDFAQLRLPDQDIEDLRTCRVGDCEVKLGEDALQRFQKEVNWQESNAREEADTLMRRLALEYVTGYLEGGNEQLAVYRDGSRPTFVAQELRAMIDRMPELTSYMPEIRKYLLEYPKVTLPAAQSFLYWQETAFGLKPTIRVTHLTVRDDPNQTVVVSKMIYATHYFWTGLELRALLPDPSRGEGFWFVMVNRSRSDGLSGSIGLFVRGRVRSEVQDGTLSALRSTKQRLEASR